MPVIFDIWTFGYRETHLAKDQCDLINGLADGMDRALAFRNRRKRDIDLSRSSGVDQVLHHQEKSFLPQVHRQLHL